MNTAKPNISNLFSLTTKRVTDLVLDQSRQVFTKTGIELDAKMTSIVALIHQAEEPLTSTALAARTGLSRQLVESRLGRLVRDGYLEVTKDKTDLRRRLYTIADKKRSDVDRVLSTTADFEAVYERVWIELGFDLQQGLRDLEASLENRSLLSRLLETKPGYEGYLGQGDQP